MTEGVIGFWTAVSAVVCAFFTGVLGPYLVARFHLKSKGISPEELSQATNRVEYRHTVDESVRLAIGVAHDAQRIATLAEKETAEVIEKNKKLEEENAGLRARVTLLEQAVKEIPKLQREIKRLRLQLKQRQPKVRRKR